MSVFGRIETEVVNLWSLLTIRRKYSFKLRAEIDGAKVWYPADKETRKLWFGDCEAFTVGEDIYIPYKTHFTSKPHIIRHELKHVEQQRRLGLLFPLAYWVETAFVGYAKNSFEREARIAELSS
jgi:hypothetical protein